MKKIFSVALAIVVLVVACNKPQATVEKPLMQNSADSMSYVIGLNLGANLIGIDSLLNVEAVCAGLRDAYVAEAKLNPEEARAAYLKYLNYDIYERVDAFEKQFLADLRKEDRKFVATSTGLTYKVHTLGDMKKVVRNNRDTILVRYRAMNVAGEIVDTTYLNADTLRIAVGEMPRGVIEASKLIGEGGHMEAWVPSRLAFGSAGCDSLAILPNTMLYYELWLIDIEDR
ncbi:MAG: FKBP-type peptidyl-prolyl cis-trans isomerase N-terminal domain-containing protein [Alistipes sp.]|jgi:FKBP-type peptidyl-prolyl cis-trans isomerase|nr:FKBP-type peptidyl-prolyl cis-trans isomerase [Alistipes sp.]MEE1148202.1 FKBP-type peptidyl-prolyl cis-trans isomerase N-terminal domain-containing protein [Alistipes sp.]